MYFYNREKILTQNEKIPLKPLITCSNALKQLTTKT